MKVIHLTQLQLVGLGYSDEKIIQLCNQYMSQGWRHFKVKVGLDLEADVKRLELIRNTSW